MDTQPPAVSLPGIVETIIESPHPHAPDKAQIAIEGADDLYRELRIENTLTAEDGDEVSLKPGAPVQITIKAVGPAATIPLDKN